MFDLCYLFSWRDFKLLTTAVFWRKYIYVDVYFWAGRKEPTQVSEEIKKAEGKWLGKLLTSRPSGKLHRVYACTVLFENGMVMHCSNSSTWEDGAGTSLAAGHLEFHNKTPISNVENCIWKCSRARCFLFFQSYQLAWAFPGGSKVATIRAQLGRKCFLWVSGVKTIRLYQRQPLSGEWIALLWVFFHVFYSFSL